MIDRKPILLSIIVPVFNEEKTIKEILEKLTELKKKNQVLKLLLLMMDLKIIL